MPVDRNRVYELALSKLMGEKSQVDAEIADLRAQMGDQRGPVVKAAKPVVRRGRRPKAYKKAAKKTAALKKGGRNPKTASAMKKLWSQARAAGFSNLKEFKASRGA